MKRTPLTRASQLKRTRWRPKPPNVEEWGKHQDWVQFVKERAGGYCEYLKCKAHISLDSGHIVGGPMDPHHIQPRGRGGKDDPHNGALLCRNHHQGIHDHVLPDWRDWLASNETEARAIRARLDNR